MQSFTVLVFLQYFKNVIQELLLYLFIERYIANGKVSDVVRKLHHMKKQHLYLMIH